MKILKQICISDEIMGKESEDYIGEYSPYRLSVILINENSETVFDISEEKVSIEQ